ncbi:MAG TPA: glycosyl hydrolase family 28 protein [Verrucomicrobiae bacterium]|nr:glycosyl hydrolase family 28 protein [Verrucomicrobiae bacterium]
MKLPFIISLPALVALSLTLALRCPAAEQKIFNVLDYGAKGDGVTLDTAAIQQTIDAAATTGNGARVLIPKGHTFLISTLVLRANIDFHLQAGAELVISTNRADYAGDGVLTARNAENLTLSGRGKFLGRALSFMTRYDAQGEWWLFKDWRPKMFVLTGCTNLIVRDLTFGDAPEWGLHLLGCHRVLVDGITIRNHLDVPNCDGIDPDHCTGVLIKNCDIRSGDDAIVIKATRQAQDYGPSADIHVQDCVIETQDSGLKIGTETTSDIRNIVFERCKIRTSSRGLTIQLRDEGSVSNIVFRDIQFTARYYSDPWWGRGEAISFTAIPRTGDTRLGKIQAVRVENVRGVAENSIRVYGTEPGHIENVRFDNVSVKLNRWTKYPGGLFDNRPTKVDEPVPAQGNPGFALHNAARITLRNCRVRWGGNAPDYFTHALEAGNVANLQLSRFTGEAAHPQRDAAIRVN